MHHQLSINTEIKKSVFLQLHETHLGVAKMKGIARAHFFWLGLILMQTLKNKLRHVIVVLFIKAA